MEDIDNATGVYIIINFFFFFALPSEGCGGCEIDRYPAHRWNARDVRTQLLVQLVEEGKISKQLEDHRDKVHPNVCTILKSGGWGRGCD